MAKTVALRKEEQTLRHELTSDELVSQAQRILEIKEKVMRQGGPLWDHPGL